MSVKKVRKAIEILKGIEDVRGNVNEIKEAFYLAIEALEKQLSKKPIIKAKEEVPHTHDLGKLLRFHCPNCGRFIVAMYEKDGGISNNLKGCSSCLQAIDFSEYYTNRSEQ